MERLHSTKTKGKVNSFTCWRGQINQVTKIERGLKQPSAIVTSRGCETMGRQNEYATLSNRFIYKDKPPPDLLGRNVFFYSYGHWPGRQKQFKEQTVVKVRTNISPKHLRLKSLANIPKFGLCQYPAPTMSIKTSVRRIFAINQRRDFFFCS